MVEVTRTIFFCWKPVVGYEEFYEVSWWGDVRSLPRRVGWRNGRTRIRKPKSLAWFTDRSGYYRVRLTDAKGGKKFRKVHHLVLEAFVGPRPVGMLGLHRDDDKTNNIIDNLYWGTYQDNADDRIRNGNNTTGISLGEKHGGSKLKEADIPVIIELREAGVPIRRIAARFGVTDMPIHDVLKGKTWGWLSGLGAV